MLINQPSATFIHSSLSLESQYDGDVNRGFTAHLFLLLQMPKHNPSACRMILRFCRVMFRSHQILTDSISVNIKEATQTIRHSKLYQTHWKLMF